jgi:hypothetical protein
MGMEHSFWFGDYDFAESIVDMDWPSFLRKYPRLRSEVEQIIGFGVDPEPDAAAIADILARRTLKWTMQRSTSAYFFLLAIFDCLPKRHRRKYEVWMQPYEIAVLVASFCDAYLRGDIDEKTLWAVHNITGGGIHGGWLTLSRSEREQLLEGAGYGAVEKPLFPWQSNDCLRDDYSVLRSVDSKRFIAFLIRAGDENWPAPRITTEVKRELQLADDTTPRFLDVSLTRELSAQVRKRRNRFARPCVIGNFG